MGAMIYPDRFYQAIGGMDWADINDLHLLAKEAGVFSEEYRRTAVDRAEKSDIRRLIRQAKGANGEPLYANLKLRDAETGKEKRIYKQEQLFNAEDYQQAFDYHVAQAEKHVERAKGYAERGKARYPWLQLTIPLEFEQVADGEVASIGDDQPQPQH